MNLENDVLGPLRDSYEYLSRASTGFQCCKAHAALTTAPGEVRRVTEVACHNCRSVRGGEPAGCRYLRQADAFLRQARRSVASAVVAVLSRHPEQATNAASELVAWAYRAAALTEDGLPAGLAVQTSIVADPRCPAALLRRSFELLRGQRLIEPEQRASGERAALLVLGEQPDRHLGNVPLLLTPPSAQAAAAIGRVARLRVELWAQGSGELIFSPNMFCEVLPTFAEAVRAAFARVEFGQQYDVVWGMTDAGLAVDGSSAQAAMQVALMLLKEGGLYDADWAISATVDDSGRLGSVEGLVQGQGEPGPKLRAAQQKAQEKKLKRVIVSPEDFQRLSEAGRADLAAGGLEVIAAETVVEARDRVSGLATGLDCYFKMLAAAPDAPEMLPAYFEGRKPTELYIEPDVLKWVRVPELRDEGRPESRDEGETRRGAGRKDRRPSEWERTAAEARDVGEELLYGERRQREAERRVPWLQEWQAALRAQQPWRAVTLGPPGQGKSFLAQMTSRQLCLTALEQLRAEGAGLQAVPLAIVVPINALMARGIRPNESPEEALRRNLASALRQQGVSEPAVDYLAAHAHESRCWLFLDALDEVPSDTRSRETLGRFFGVIKDWSTRVVITSRPYGYAEWTLPFPVIEYRLAAFSPEQCRQFLQRWFSQEPPRRRMLNLLARSPAVAQLSQNPFLLTLVCAVSEQEELDEQITRSELYRRALRLMLGGEDRTAEWLPCLEELTWQMVQSSIRAPRADESELLRRLAESENRPPVEEDPGGLSAMQQAARLRDELRRKRVLVPAEGVWVFPHRSFADYLAAGYLAGELEPTESSLISGAPAAGTPETDAAWRLVDKKAWDPHWEQVLLFLAGRLEEPKHLLEMLGTAEPTKTNSHGDDAFRHRLALAAACLGEVRREWLDDRRNGPLARRITEESLGLWWEHQRERTDPAVAHIGKALPALAQANAQYQGQPLLVRIAELLRDQDSGVRSSAAEAVGDLGAAAATPEIVSRLAELLLDEDEDVRFSAAKAVGGLGAAAATPDILGRIAELLRDRDLRVRSSAARAVGGLGAVAAMPDILGRIAELLRDEYWEVRFSAAEAVGGLGAAAATTEFLGRLAELLLDEDEDVQSFAPRALGALGAPAATTEFLARLAELLRDPRDHVRYSTAEAAGNLGAAAATPDILSGIAKLLCDEDDYVRSSAAEAVGGLGAAAATPDILSGIAELLRDEYWEVRSTAARAVGGMGTAAATTEFLARLAGLLRDKKENVRSSAAEAVGGLGAAAATPEILVRLAELLRDRDQDVRSSAASALQAMFAQGLRVFFTPPSRWIAISVDELSS